jgi:HEAT repeat protein
MQPYVTSLNSADLAERLAADCALIDAGAVEPLLAVLNDPANANEARWRAAANLGDIGDETALESLITAVTDPSWDVRASAIWALGRLRESRAFDTLCSIVENPTPDEQNSYVAAMGLLQIDQARAVEVLRRAAASANPRIRSWGRSGLAILEF